MGKTSSVSVIDVYSAPPIALEDLHTTDAPSKLWEVRTTAPLALNSPVLVVQLPFLLLSPAKREWVPRGMLPDVWRDLSWPIAGIFFWWLLGRHLEALLSARRLTIYPRINWGETALAVILVAAGIVALIGLLTTTPDDRRDAQFMMLLAGGILWGLLSATTIAARFMQWRIAKRSAA